MSVLYLDSNQEAGEITLERMEEVLRSTPYIMRQAKRLADDYETPDALIAQAARELVHLNHAVHKDYEVWADVEVAPRNLDSGAHWYQIWFLKLEQENPDERSLNPTYKPVRHHFWPQVLMDKAPRSHDYGWGFKSSAIGTSRLQDATDEIFYLIKKAGGYYAQLS